jgi:hypothetical protein
MEWHLCISFTKPRPVSDLVGFFMCIWNGAWKDGNLAAAWTKMFNVEAYRAWGDSRIGITANGAVVVISVSSDPLQKH